MSNDQTDGRQTGASAAGSTSRSDPSRVAVGQTVCLDHPHVDGPHYGGERTDRFFAEHGLESLQAAHAAVVQSLTR